MSAQLERIQARAIERRANEGLYDHQRETDDTFVTVLCYLLGMGAISDAALDAALKLLGETDARAIALRAERAS